MAQPSVTYTFTNGQTSDGPQVSQNFTDLVNALTDGTKDVAVNAATIAGVAAVSQSSTDTLTNKTISASLNTITNIANASISSSAAIAVTKLAIGTANQIPSTNAGATANEFRTLAAGTSGTDFAVAFGSGTITLNLPDASALNRGAVTTGTQTIAGAKTFSTSIALATSGGTATALNYYEEGSFTANFNSNAGSGAGAANTSKTIKFTRTGNMVCLQFPDCSNMTAGSTDTAFKAATALPSRLRPSTQLDWVSTQMSSAGALSSTPGNISIRTNGDMFIFRNGNASTNFGIGDVNNGCSATTVFYTTA